MKIKAIISPVVQIGNEMALTTCYQINGAWRILTDNDTMESVQGELKNAKSGRKNNLLFSENLKQTLVYEYENDEKLQSQRDKEIQKVVEVFFSQHPAITYNGKHHKNTQNPLFDLVNQNEKKAAAVISFKDKLAIQNRLVEMSLEELRNVSDYYGRSPEGQSKSDLEIFLGDPNTGLCMGENADSFKNTWMEQNDNANRVVILRKAIRLKVIEERKEGTRVDYYLGQEYLGTRFEDVLAYSQREPSIYENHIKRVVEDKPEDFSKEKVDSHNEKKVEKKVEAGEETTKAWTAGEIQEMREKLYKLKDEGFVLKATPIHNLKPHTLVEKLAEAEKKKSEKEKELQQA